MAEELQGLLERIHEEGVQKAESEKERLISDARKEAAKIVSDAKTEAENIKKQAEDDAKKSEERAKAAIQQAARDIILSLKEDLLKRLKTLVEKAIGEAMTPERMGEILMTMVKEYTSQSPDAEPGVEALLNKKDVEDMEKLFNGSLVKDLKEKPEISIGHDFGSGLKVGFKGNDIFFDFTDDAISELICSFIGPKLAAMLEK